MHFAGAGFGKFSSIADRDIATQVKSRDIQFGNST
jgi:hypothetical protein